MKIQQVEHEGFPEFWELWKAHQRGTDGRGKARPAYTKLMLNGADPQDILDGARWFLRNLKDRDREFIPLASSWLNSERWADDCELERTFQKRQAERAAQASQPVPSVKPLISENHFSRRFERGEIQTQGNA